MYPEWAYPERGWIIPSEVTGIVSMAGPIIIYIAAQIRIKSAWDASNAIMGTIWAVLLASFLMSSVKTLVGGFRPYFYDVCMPNISLASNHNASGLNGSGYRQMMFTTEICTQTDMKALKNAITSFPSGHSTAGFSGFGFCFLWLNAKLKVWADYKPAFWKFFVTFIPLILAVLNSCVLTVDSAHHWYDIFAGSIIGIVMALAAYRCSYAAIWDWRYNHLPLQSREAFIYGAEGDIDYAQQTLTRRVGWGGKKDWLTERPDDVENGSTRAHQSTALSGAGTSAARERLSPGS